MNRGQRRPPPQASGNPGDALMEQSRFAEAEAAYRNSLKVRPGDAELCGNLGVALDRQGKYAEAEIFHRRALALKPNWAEAHFNLGAALMKQNRLDDAAASFKQALALKPAFPAACNNIGNIRAQQGRFEDAAAEYRRALAIKPDYEDACNNLGNVLSELGRLDEAVAAYNRALEIKPDFAEAHYNLSAKKTYAADDPHLKTLEAMARWAAKLTPKARMNMWFALGKAREDIGRYDEAFAAWDAGNKLKRETITFDEARAAAAIDDIIRRYDGAFARKKKSRLFGGEAGCADETPVFIVGMPRAGTTLAEQILASHSRVQGGGELPFLPQIVSAVTGRPAGDSYMDWLLRAGGGTLRRTGEAYAGAVRAIAGENARATDKLPRNFLFCGLIHKILPRSKIIHVTRDPMDTCLSLYALLFQQNLPWAYDLAELGRQYRRYAKLMDHWKTVLPAGRILEVRYEDIVTDLPGQARRMVAHCGLDWEDSCLDFHKNGRPVRTASLAQVRRSLYSTSVGRWKRFEKHLGPLQAALEGKP
jgi:tetratricopeptide (TPR) repeat protein